MDTRVCEGYHPQARVGALVATDYGAAAVADGTVDFCKGYHASSVAQVTTESNKCDASPVITWPTQALAMRSGKSRVQMC